jgi:hypothetical protein
VLLTEGNGTSPRRSPAGATLALRVEPLPEHLV